MPDWRDLSAGVTVIEVSVDVFLLLGPVEVSANAFQSSYSVRVSHSLRFMAVS